MIFTGKRQLLEYEIQDWKLFIDNTGEMSQAEVKIVFRRFDLLAGLDSKTCSQEYRVPRLRSFSTATDFTHCWIPNLLF